MFETIVVFFLSKFPVGSSANIIFGSKEIALAIATLCCSPPESSEGKLFTRLESPTLDNIENAFFFHQEYC